MKKMNSALFGICLLLFSSHAAIGTGATFDEVVVFGDSLSDNGNLVIVEGQPLPDPTLYYQGRLSNGPVWAEYLTDPRHLGTALSDKAYGGANSSGLLPPGVIQQVTAYTVSVGSPLPADHLFAIWGGANDYLNDGKNPETVISNIEAALERLAQFGAEHILVLNLPDLGTIPDKRGTAEAAGATAFSTNYNSGLAAMLDQFRLAYPDIGLYTYDIFSLVQSVQNNPGAYGFVNATDTSPNFSVPNNFDGAGYLFWDDLHPTTEMHALIADEVYLILNEEETPPDMDDDDNGSSGSGSSGCFLNSLRW